MRPCSAEAAGPARGAPRTATRRLWNTLECLNPQQRTPPSAALAGQDARGEIQIRDFIVSWRSQRDFPCTLDEGHSASMGRPGDARPLSASEWACSRLRLLGLPKRVADEGTSVTGTCVPRSPGGSKSQARCPSCPLRPAACWRVPAERGQSEESALAPRPARAREAGCTPARRAPPAGVPTLGIEVSARGSGGV